MTTTVIKSYDSVLKSVEILRCLLGRVAVPEFIVQDMIHNIQMFILVHTINIYGNIQTWFKDNLVFRSILFNDNNLFKFTNNFRYQ